MLMITITQSGSAITEEIKAAYGITPATKVYEYSYNLINIQDNDIQADLTAAFTHIPTLHDWDNHLSGWASCGYFLSSQPVLINTFAQPSY
jgi:hypothetical protein